MTDIPSRYNPKEAEDRLYSFWESQNFFSAKPNPSKEPFCIVIPPPNITGILHMGHALNNTIQDILIRFKRGKGFEALWVPGTDHAGIATQNVVEKKIAERGLKRQDLGREAFLEEVWRWRQNYGNTIINQLKRLGSSCDWNKTRFTMDEGLSNAVLEAFARLYNKRLIYKGNYIINWCPRCQTALSDEEAPYQEVEGRLYYIKYPFKEGQGSRVKGQGVVVATTRPETMLGDVAVAVNPKDKRYKKLIGSRVILPLMEREIEIIADTIVDPDFGTGAVKVTPAHDPYDFEISSRHNLKALKVMGPDGSMNENAGAYKDLDRFKAREAIIKDLEERKLILKTEKHIHSVGHCYRCHTIIEPYLSEQWFVRMKPLAKPAIVAVKKGKIKFYPTRWTKVYLNWMENIKDWCISRQIWWGHRLPVYYCKNCVKQANEVMGHGSWVMGNDECKKGVIVSKMHPEKCPICGSADIYQDEDVLDTWFSSWLWPFSVFGWPETQHTEPQTTNRKPRAENRKPKTELTDLDYFYPTSVLVTAPEIIFFWVARMIMAGLEFIGEVPFKDVYIHGTVRDLTGAKMSKSLGNIIDPIDIIEEFGADALRFSMISITATGQDVFLSREKFELGRNFANKIWNASRFVLMNVKQSKEQRAKSKELGLSIVDRWILSRLHRIIYSVTKALENYRFNEAANTIYEFFWHEFCDWYLELTKPEIVGEKPETSLPRAKSMEAQKPEEVLIYVLEDSLKLIHPFMPFVTEEVWQKTHQGGTIMLSKWPNFEKRFIDSSSEKKMSYIIDTIKGIRNIRSEMNIGPQKRIEAVLVPLERRSEEAVRLGIEYIKLLAKLKDCKIDKNFKAKNNFACSVVGGISIYVPLEGIIDIEAEKRRLEERFESISLELERVNGKLKNREFIMKAPKQVVEMEKVRKTELEVQAKKIRETLKSFN